MTDTLALDRKHTALMIMDFQKGIVPQVVEKYPDLLDKTAAVLAAARAAGLPIIYIVVSFREGYPEVSPRNLSFSSMRESGRLLAGSSETEVHPQVGPHPGDIVLAKHRVGAFSTTPLETILCAQDITSLILCGIATSGVVLSTVRDAADRDFDILPMPGRAGDSLSHDWAFLFLRGLPV